MPTEESDSTPPRPEFSRLSIARMVWKRKLFIGCLWILLAGGTVAVVWNLPTVYLSEAIILVDSQKIPEKFVTATVASDLQDRITTIRQQLLSTGNLRKIISDFNLYRKERAARFEEEILELMRKDISITVEEDGLGRSGRSARLGAFRIGYQGEDAALVAQVANRLANLYVEENLKTREGQAEGTSEFIDTQLTEAKKRLDDLEATVSVFKVKYNGELPEQERTLVGTLSRLQVELEANRDAINRAQQTHIILENSLSAAEASLGAARARAAEMAQAAAELRAGEGAAGQAARFVPQKRRSEVLQEELDGLRLRYSDAHPDVVRLRGEVERFKRTEDLARPAEAETMDAAAKPGQTAPRPPGAAPSSPEALRVGEQVAALRAQIKGSEKELESRRTEQERVLRDISRYQSRMERLPLREQEMARITRDYEISKENYKSLLDKKNAAEMALDMERRQKSERFTVLDPARVPEKPLKPKRPLLYAIGTIASLLLAMAAGVGLELKRNVVLGEWELPPDTLVLARLPNIEIAATASGEPARRGRRSGKGPRTIASHV